MTAHTAIGIVLGLLAGGSVCWCLYVFLFVEDRRY